MGLSPPRLFSQINAQSRLCNNFVRQEGIRGMEAAAASVLDLLSGAIEARLPASRCAAVAAPGEIMARACDGWRLLVRMGAGPGDRDVISVRAGS